MKSKNVILNAPYTIVAPFTGAWIEIRILLSARFSDGEVAPFTGAWIEILPFMPRPETIQVAPFTGAWIEI